MAASLVIALDFPALSRCADFVDRIQQEKVWFKLGLELFTASGPVCLETIRRHGHPVFLDLKFHDIPNTVAGAVRSATRLGVQMLTVHAQGGKEMMRAAVRGRQEALEGQLSLEKTLILGITVLTSEARAGNAGMADVVRQRALAARESGLDGVVCSGWEVAVVKEACGDDFLCLCPGIRLEESSGIAGTDDQARVCTPRQAVRAGADFLVMGRPVTQAADPVQVIQTVMAGMGAGAVE